MSNEFTNCEAKGRELLYNVLTQCFNLNPTTITFTDNYCRHDCETSEYLIEVKVMNVTHTQYPDYVLEAEKLEYMLSSAALTGKKPLYVNFFTDGVCVIWGLSGVKQRVLPVTKRCKQTTAKYGGYINKQVYMLAIDNTAMIIQYNNKL